MASVDSVRFENGSFVVVLRVSKLTVIGYKEQLRDAAVEAADILWNNIEQSVRLFDGIQPRCPKSDYLVQNLWDRIPFWCERAQHDGFNQIRFQLVGALGEDCFVRYHGEHSMQALMEDYICGHRLVAVHLERIDNEQQCVMRVTCRTRHSTRKPKFELTIFDKGTPVIQACCADRRDVLDSLEKAVCARAMSRVEELLKKETN